MKKKSKFMIAGVSFVAFILLMILVRIVDYAPVGPQGSGVGFSHLNAWMHALIGEHEFFYQVTQVLGIVALMIVAAFAVLGAYQLFTRKSLLKVDKCILVLGGLYIITGAIYLLFSKVSVNMRPMITWGETELEPSFPSSHTVLGCVVMGSALMILDRYISNEKLSYWLRLLCLVMMILLVVLRFLSGVHWFTDIIGGILLSVSLLACFAGIVGKAEKRGKHGMR